MIGVGIPQVDGGGPTSLRRLVDFLRSAEEAGYQSGWVAEAPLDRPSLDPLAVLAIAAAHTSRMRLGTAVLVLPNHSPELLMRAVAGVDHLSGGRVMLGVGIGEPRVATEGFGESPKQRVDRFENAIALLRSAWVDARVESADVDREPALLIGARVPRSLRRAGRLGDGWVCSAHADLGQFVAQRDVVRAELSEQQRDASAFTLVKRCYVAIDQRPAEVEEWFRLVTGKESPRDDVVLLGRPADVEERLLELRDAGADELIVQCVGSDERRQMEALAEHGTVSRLTPLPMDGALT